MHQGEWLAAVAELVAACVDRETGQLRQLASDEQTHLVSWARSLGLAVPETAEEWESLERLQLEAIAKASRAAMMEAIRTMVESPPFVGKGIRRRMESDELSN